MKIPSQLSSGVKQAYAGSLKGLLALYAPFEGLVYGNCWTLWEPRRRHKHHAKGMHISYFCGMSKCDFIASDCV